MCTSLKKGEKNMSNKSNLSKKVVVILIIIVFLNSFSTFINGESTKTSILLQIGNPTMIANNSYLPIDPINSETVPVVID